MNDPTAERDLDCRRPVVDLEFREDALQVRLHRALADAERRRNLFVPRSLRDQLHHVDLPGRQRRVRRALGQPRLNVGAHGRLARMNFTDHANEIVGERGSDGTFDLYEEPYDERA